MSWVAVGVGAVSLAAGIAQSVAANKQKKKMLELQEKAGTYKENPLARQNFALAQNMFNGRMAGASALEQNIFANQANTQANIERNATDSGTSLALSAGLQGQTNDQLKQLQVMEDQDKKERYGMLVNAEGQLVNEGDKVWQDKMRVLDQKMAIYGVAAANQQQAIGTMANGVAGIAGGLSNGFANKQAGYNFSGTKYVGGMSGNINPYAKPWYYNNPVDTTSSYSAPRQSIFANSYPG